MNEQRLRELMDDSVGDISASDSLRGRVSVTIGARRARRRTAVRGWIAVGGAAVAAAAVLLAVPLIRTPQSAPPGPGVGLTAPTPTAATPVDDIGEVLGNKKWYVIGIVAHASSLALDAPTGADTAMSIQLTDSGLQGHDGCNWIGSDPALLTSVPNVRVNISSTGSLCTRVPHGQDEFLDALRSGPKSWSRDGDVVILSAAAIEVRFSKDRTALPPSKASVLSSEQDAIDLLGFKTWYVTGILASGKPVAVYRPSDPQDGMWIAIRDRTVTASDGCNFIRGPLTRLTILYSGGDGWDTTQTVCPVTPGQGELMAVLQSGGKSWTHRGDEVVLRAGSYEITFGLTPPPSSTAVDVTGPSSRQDVVQLLGSKTWYVAKIFANGDPVEVYRPTDQERAMRIEVDDPSVTGFDGCNWIGAATAALSSAPTTQVHWSRNDGGCTPTPPGQAEFFKAVQAPNKAWAKRGGELVLRTDDSEITFSAAPPAPTAAAPTTG